jgi:glycosyltransferase involved in cell wall biosynthesis
VYSREILWGAAAAHPGARLLFCYRPHRFFRSFKDSLEPNCRRHLLQDPCAPRSADRFHGLNQRLPRARLRRADLIVADSEFTAQQVESCLGMEPSQLRVIHVGVRPPANESPALATRERIVLHAGAIQKRQNIARLVQAFERPGADWRLVLAGSMGFSAFEIAARMETSPARARIEVLGYVPEWGLARWYDRRAILAFRHSTKASARRSSKPWPITSRC